MITDTFPKITFADTFLSIYHCSSRFHGESHKPETSDKCRHLAEYHKQEFWSGFQEVNSANVLRLSSYFCYFFSSREVTSKRQSIYRAFYHLRSLGKLFLTTKIYSNNYSNAVVSLCLWFYPGLITATTACGGFQVYNFSAYS